jgi:hypothetical protein
MKVKVQWAESRIMEAVVDAESIEAAKAAWALGYDDDSGWVDEVENAGVEIDGGIIWGSCHIWDGQPEDDGSGRAERDEQAP